MFLARPQALFSSRSASKWPPPSSSGANGSACHLSVRQNTRRRNCAGVQRYRSQYDCSKIFIATTDEEEAGLIPWRAANRFNPSASIRAYAVAGSKFPLRLRARNRGRLGDAVGAPELVGPARDGHLHLRQFVELPATTGRGAVFTHALIVRSAGRALNSRTGTTPGGSGLSKLAMSRLRQCVGVKWCTRLYSRQKWLALV